MLKYGIATDEELKAGHALAPMKKADEPVTAAKVANMVRCGSPYGRPAPAPPKFKAGDKDYARVMSIRKRTRACPALRRAGIQARWCVLSDATSFQTATRLALARMPTGFTPCGSMAANYGAQDSDPTVGVAIEAWEPYLKSA